jgi:hypothetical protein
MQAYDAKILPALPYSAFANVCCLKPKSHLGEPYGLGFCSLDRLVRDFQLACWTPTDWLPDGHPVVVLGRRPTGELRLSSPKMTSWPAAMGEHQRNVGFWRDWFRSSRLLNERRGIGASGDRGLEKPASELATSPGHRRSAAAAPN